MSKEENVVKYYVMCNKLKDLIRTGWKVWSVERNRVESVAEHILGVQMLALAMQSEYHYDIEIQRVIMMIAVHELEEISIGDFTPFEISEDEKRKLGEKAVKEILGTLTDSEQLAVLITEFEQRTTKEARFAYFCDKLECDIQSKLYDEEGCVDLNHQVSNPIMKDERVKALLDSGLSWSEMWLKFDQQNIGYDENFLEVSNYVLTHKINQQKNSHL